MTSHETGGLGKHVKRELMPVNVNLSSVGVALGIFMNILILHPANFKTNRRLIEQQRRADSDLDKKYNSSNCILSQTAQQ